jgi:capsular polysaccharide biosynthesis protein
MERNLRETTKRFALRSLRRRWWVIPLAVLATALAGYGAATLKKETYSASSWVIATSDTGTRGPGQAFDASRLALSYASSLSEDDQLINYVAQAINRPRNEVDDNLSTLNQTDTAVLRLRYRDEDRQVATAAARAAAEGAVGQRPVASSVTPGTLSLVQLATEPERSTNLIALGLGVGALLGLGLGIILMLAWERADPRLDKPADVQALTGIPTTRLDDLTPSRAAALLERWLGLANRPNARVAMVPTKKMQPLADLVAGWLYGLHVDGPELSPPAPTNGAGLRNGEGTPEHPSSDETDFEGLTPASDPGQEPWRSRWFRPATAPSPGPWEADQPTEQVPAQGAIAAAQSEAPAAPHVPAPATSDIPHGERVTLVAGGPGGSASAPEVEALRSDLIVLLVQSSATSREVLELVETLEQFGRRPAWALMVNSQRKLLREMDNAQARGVSLRSGAQGSSAAPRD